MTPGGQSALATAQGGPGLLDPRARAHQLGVLEELITHYDSDGVELDFACAPGGGALCFRKEDAAKGAPLLTEMLRQNSTLCKGKGKIVGARVYPTAEMNARAGLEVELWIAEGVRP